MNKKKIIIVVIAIGGVLFSSVIAIMLLSSALAKRTDDSRNKALFNIVVEYISSDKTFEKQYGKFESAEQYGDGSITIISDKECNIPCVIKTESGKSYLIWMYYNFYEETDVFEYISVEEINTEN